MTNLHLIAPDINGRFAMQDGSASGERSSAINLREHREHAPGDVLAGKYEILGVLGQGGMGKVWRAHSLPLDIDVAIKVLHREHADSSAAERLRREARATAKLGHSAIVRVIDFGETDAGEPFLVMELLEGTSLAGWLQRKGRMSAAQAVQMLLPIADALAEAHKQGIVHRDIKPENIIAVPHEGDTYQPKIVDFGIAKLLAHDSAQVLTHVGTVLGSLEYMSPEQAEGRLEVGEATDVWSLAVVLYELITGKRPFDGPTITAMMFALYTRAPAPTTQFAAGDRELWEIIERGLEKSPEDRWPSMRAFGRALALWAAERGIDRDASGVSLSHHWLAMSSRPLGFPENDGGVIPSVGVAPSAAPTSCAPEPALSLADVAAEACSEPLPIASAEVLKAEHLAPLARSPRVRALFATALFAFLAPVMVATGLYVRRGVASASTSSQTAPAAVMAPAVMPMVNTVVATPTAIATPAPVDAPSDPVTTVSPSTTDAPNAPGATPAPTYRARALRTPALTPKRSSTAMPLPATPNF